MRDAGRRAQAHTRTHTHARAQPIEPCIETIRDKCPSENDLAARLMDNNYNYFVQIY